MLGRLIPKAILPIVRLEWSRLRLLGPLDALVACGFGGVLLPAVIAPWLAPVVLPFAIEGVRTRAAAWRATDEFLQVRIEAGGLEKARWLFELECLLACSGVTAVVHVLLTPRIDEVGLTALLPATLALSLWAYVLRLALSVAGWSRAGALGWGIVCMAALAFAPWLLERALFAGPLVCAGAALAAVVVSGWLAPRAPAATREPARVLASSDGASPVRAHRTLLGALLASDLRLMLRTGLWRRSAWLWAAAFAVAATAPVPLTGIALVAMLAFAQQLCVQLWGGGEPVGSAGFALRVQSAHAAPVSSQAWYRLRTLECTALVLVIGGVFAALRVGWFELAASAHWGAFVLAVVPLALLQGGAPSTPASPSRLSMPHLTCWAFVLWEVLAVGAASWRQLPEAAQALAPAPALPAPLELFARAMEVAPVLTTVGWLAVCALAFRWGERAFLRRDVRRVRVLIPRGEKSQLAAR